MQGKKLSIGLRTTLLTGALTLYVSTAYAATEKVLHNFTDNGSDGFNPRAGLIFDTAVGNLYERNGQRRHQRHGDGV